MKKKDIRIGKKVWYYPILGFDEREEAFITSEPVEICGTTCCFINIRTSVVAIENLEEMNYTANGWLSMHNETQKLKDCYGKEIHIGDILEDKFKRYYVAEMYCGNMNTRFVMYNKIDDKEKIELSSALTYTTQEMILDLEFAIVGNTNEYKNVIICE